jgi:hypothetical protein
MRELDQMVVDLVGRKRFVVDLVAQETFDRNFPGVRLPDWGFSAVY